jgi:Na+-driven multidrug efflux pump
VVLSELSLVLSFVSIFFVFITFLQLGIQSEFSKYNSSRNYVGLLKLLQVNVLFVTVISIVVIAGIWIMPNPFITSDNKIAQDSYKALKILAFSLPLVGILSCITYFLEGIGNIARVTTLRVYQFFVQVTLVSLALFFRQKMVSNSLSTVLCVSGAYVLSDLIMLTSGAFLLLGEINKITSLALLKTINNSYYSELLNIFRLGLPVMFGAVGQKVIFYFCISYCATLGIWQTFAFTVINSITYFFQIPLIGVAGLLTINLGHARGADNGPELSKIVSKFKKIFFFELILIALFLYVFFKKVIIFFSNDYEIINHLLELKALLIAYFVMNALLIYTMSALRGLSDNLVPQLIILSLLSLGLSPCFNVFHMQFDLNQMIMLFTFSGFLASSILYIRFNTKCVLQSNKLAQQNP